MKIGKHQINFDANIQFYILTAFFILASWSASSVWPIIDWVIFCVILLPLCIWLGSDD